MGDGVVAYFGYPRAHEHDAEREVQASLALVEAVPRLATHAGSPLQVRVGIAIGLVVVADLIGSGAAQEQAVVGETPNLAARLHAIHTALEEKVKLTSILSHLDGSEMKRPPSIDELMDWIGLRLRRTEALLSPTFLDPRTPRASQLVPSPSGKKSYFS